MGIGLLGLAGLIFFATGGTRIAVGLGAIGLVMVRLCNIGNDNGGYNVWPRRDRSMFVRFHVNPAIDEPHIYDHGVAESEVLEILRTSTDRGGARDGATQAVGQTRAGRYLKVVYVEDPDGILVVTAYDLRANELKAFRRRRRRRHHR